LKLDILEATGFQVSNGVTLAKQLRLTNGKPALAHRIGDVETKFG